MLPSHRIKRERGRVAAVRLEDSNIGRLDFVKVNVVSHRIQETAQLQVHMSVATHQESVELKAPNLPAFDATFYHGLHTNPGDHQSG